jgi:outer membrane beta-barrel protein
VTYRLQSTAALLFACLVLLSAPAAAQTKGQEGQLYSIEKRDLLGNHELSVSVGVLPMDAFYKGITLQGSYSYHFNRMLGWEVIGGLYSFNIDTGLKDELNDRFQLQPTELGQLQWLLNSNFLFKPLYGKVAVANDLLFTGEMFFVLGYALGGFTSAYPSGVDAGIGFRMFLSRYFSMRLDIRDYVFFSGEVSNNLYIALGVSLTFGFSDDEEEQGGGR